MPVNEKSGTSILSALKRDFEADSTYLVFESVENPEESIEFKQVIRVLRRLDKRLKSRKMYHDQETGQYVWVIQVDPQDKERVTEALLETGLPNAVRFSVYGSRPEV
jgi:hypothetical protein